jgi:thymidylate synthase ThyX
MIELRSAPPEVRLVHAFDRPLDGAVAAARSCYARRGLVTAEEVGAEAIGDPVERSQALSKRDALAKDLYQAGHHTIYQHAHFQFAIDRVSRQALWSFFHAHPFYNSEQVSQRYVKVSRGSVLIPELGGEAQSVYEEILAAQEEAYRELTGLLFPVAEAAFYEVFPARRKRPDAWKKQIRRKAQEVARYVLPLATWARLYHTVSAITLLRYRRASRQPGVPSEVARIVDAMVAAVLELDPDFAVVLEAPLDPEAMPETGSLAGNGGLVDPDRAVRFAREFDEEQGGWVSRLIGHAPDAETAVAQAVREVLGLTRSAIDDPEAIALAADPARNAVLGDALNLTTVTPVTRALHHAHYTFRRKLSHSADSQDQRHRTTPGSRPLLAAHLSDGPDVVTPPLVEESDEAGRVFREICARTWEGILRLRRLGAPEEALVYALPNAVAVRFTESADFLALRHKHEMRLCYNAQEEIWRASVEEAQQIRRVHPALGAHLLPPCGTRLRGGSTPICPEGKRYCGVPVWKLEPEQYARRI